MKWWPDEPAPGDIIRVRIGTVYHYGVYVGPEEIIQFGPPPTGSAHRVPASITVETATPEEFSCGAIIECGKPDRSEARRRRPPAETIAAARARLGEGGYDLLHNNCEHFAYECVFGEHFCAQADAVRRRWNSRPILNVYLAPIPDDAVGILLHSEERMKQLRRTGNEQLRKARTYDWAVLEYALARSFGCDAQHLRFRRNRFGKWSCGAYFFSLAHTGGAVAVAVSNGPVGIDLENEADFAARYAPRQAEMLHRIRTAEETDTDFLSLWLKKESFYKAGGTGSFRPAAINTAGKSALVFRCRTLPGLRAAVCGEKLSAARFYLYENGTARSIQSDILRSE